MFRTLTFALLASLSVAGACQADDIGNAEAISGVPLIVQIEHANQRIDALHAQVDALQRQLDARNAKDANRPAIVPCLVPISVNVMQSCALAVGEMLGSVADGSPPKANPTHDTQLAQAAKQHTVFVGMTVTEMHNVFNTNECHVAVQSEDSDGTATYSVTVGGNHRLSVSPTSAPPPPPAPRRPGTPGLQPPAGMGYVTVLYAYTVTVKNAVVIKWHGFGALPQ